MIITSLPVTTDSGKQENKIMTHRHLPHAERVVQAFKDNLSDSGRQHVGEKHFDELILMIESAISTSVLEDMEHAADKLAHLAEELRKGAEHL